MHDNFFFLHIFLTGIKLARDKASDLGNVSFVSGFSDSAGLENSSADIVTCSQSFHWMKPQTTLNELSRILKDGGVFAVYDCDWPPVCNWEAEFEYEKLFEKVSEIESRHPDIQSRSVKFDKENHLANIKNSRLFRYVREIAFSNTEICNAERFIGIALSQGGLQSIVKSNADEICPSVLAFTERIKDIFGAAEFEIDFCYRMRIGVK